MRASCPPAMCEDAFRDATGAMLISKSAVSEPHDQQATHLPGTRDLT
jgi:hypothetical protein